MEAVKEKLSAVGKKIKDDDPAKVIRGQPQFHKNLTDVGLYSLGGLCTVSLLKLFDEDCHLEFKKKALQKILQDLGQPKQTNESMFAILEGEIMDDSDNFVDALLEEEALKESKKPLVADLIALSIREGCYDARMRVLIKHVAWQLRVTWEQVEEIEGEMAETIEYHTYVMTEEQTKEKDKKRRNRNIKRYALIGLATVGGGALIGLTGGLAAPLVAAGAGAIIGGAGAAALGSAAGVAIIGSLFGVAGAGLTGYKMKRRVGAIEEFAFDPLTLRGSKFDPALTVKQLHITIAVTGWINSDIMDFRYPWSALAESHEQYSLRWESKYLYQLGEGFESIIQVGLNMATTEALKYTILAGIITAIAWPAALISAAGAIDNPWHVCTQRANEAGKQLAEVLLSREQGNRPVTLIGFSMGARVIFSCLEEMCKRKGHEGLIEDVILLGAPVSADVKHWKPLTKVVAGKIVNGYARGDWLLKFLYRTASVTFRVAGLRPVKWDNRRMHNIDLSDIIGGHMDYMKNIDVVLKAVGVRTKDELRAEVLSRYKREHPDDKGSTSHSQSSIASNTPSDTASHTPSDSASHTPIDSASHTLSDSASHTPSVSASHMPSQVASSLEGDVARDTANGGPNAIANDEATGKAADTARGTSSDVASSTANNNESKVASDAASGVSRDSASGKSGDSAQPKKSDMTSGPNVSSSPIMSSNTSAEEIPSRDNEVNTKAVLENSENLKSNNKDKELQEDIEKRVEGMQLQHDEENTASEIVITKSSGKMAACKNAAKAGMKSIDKVVANVKAKKKDLLEHGHGKDKATKKAGQSSKKSKSQEGAKSSQEWEQCSFTDSDPELSDQDQN